MQQASGADAGCEDRGVDAGHAAVDQLHQGAVGYHHHGLGAGVDLLQRRLRDYCGAGLLAGFSGGNATAATSSATWEISRFSSASENACRKGDFH